MLVTLLLFLKTVRVLWRLAFQTVTTWTTYVANWSNTTCSARNRVASVTLYKDCLMLSASLLRNCLADSNLMRTARLLETVSFIRLLLLRIYSFLRRYHCSIARSWVIQVLDLVCWLKRMITMSWLYWAKRISLRGTSNNTTLIDPTNSCIWTSMMILETITSHIIPISSWFDYIHRWYVYSWYSWLLFKRLNMQLWID
jgi:hypothetical protein